MELGRVVSYPAVGTPGSTWGARGSPSAAASAGTHKEEGLAIMVNGSQAGSIQEGW